jgi:hypothetical protein
MWTSMFVGEDGLGGAAGGSPIAGIVGGLIAYVFFAACWKVIAKKSGEADKAWWAWVPILNLLLALKVAGKPGWWFLLMLVPVVNFFTWIVVCMGAAGARGKGGGVGIIAALIPVIGLPLLAMGEEAGGVRRAYV